MIELSADAGDWPAEPVLRRIVASAATAISAAVPNFPVDRSISVLFTNDDRMALLNATWRRKEGPTNVLSFPAPAMTKSPESARSLGDIVLGFETVTKEATGSHLTLADYISHLLVHGLLHLMGYDHQEDARAEAMEALEAVVLAKLGIADPYAGGEPQLIDTAGSNGQ